MASNDLIDVHKMSRDELVFMARVAEQAERYKEMVQYMSVVARNEDPLSVDERNLLSVAYKNVVGTRRASWRVLTALQVKPGEPKHNVEVSGRSGTVGGRVEGW